MIAEYKDLTPEQFSTHTVLAVGSKGRNEYKLIHMTPGYEPAGSVARLREVEAYAVQFYSDGATHGRAFLSEEPARALFNKWTTV